MSDASNDARAESTEPVVPLAAEATSPAAPALQSLAPPEGKKTGPTTARLREQLRAGNRDRSAVQVAVAPRTSEQEMRAVLKELSSVTYLPIRPINTDVAGRGRARFSLVVDKSAAEDADLIARVARVQEDEQAQKLLAAAWQAFLSRLRADLTTGRSDRPSTERIEWLDKGDPRLRAAFSAASDTREVASTLADARAYWDRRDQQAVPVAAPSSSAVPEPFELRNRGSDEEEDYQRLLAMGRFGAKTKGRD